MKIRVSVTDDELEEMGFDAEDLERHIIEALDSCVKEMPGFTIEVD